VPKPPSGPGAPPGRESGSDGRGNAVPVTPVPSGRDAARLQAELDASAGCGAVGVLWGDWRPGVCVHAHADGLVWATDRGLGEGLRDVRLYGLNAASPPELRPCCTASNPGRHPA
jgi:hypothetical protein